MDYTEYTAVKNRFTSHPNLCDLFKLLSIETWKRIEYAYIKPRVKVFETTVTQNLIFTINAYNDQYGMNIEVLEALDERTNGNDFELIIRFPVDGIEYYAPIQAKKVYRDGRYVSMDHGAQIESLIEYANLNNSKPLYLLYNFAPAPFRTGISLTTPSELTGCTLISAEYLRDNYYKQKVKRDGSLTWSIPHFYDLNPDFAFPWHELVCPSDGNELYTVLKKKGLAAEIDTIKTSELATVNKDYKQGFYPIDSISSQEGWINVDKLSVSKKDFEKLHRVEEKAYRIREVDDEKFEVNKELKHEKTYPKFSPKSRMIISKQQ